MFKAPRRSRDEVQPPCAVAHRPWLCEVVRGGCRGASLLVLCGFCRRKTDYFSVNCDLLLRFFVFVFLIYWTKNMSPCGGGELSIPCISCSYLRVSSICMFLFMCHLFILGALIKSMIIHEFYVV